jgi:hypothetical protein
MVVVPHPEPERVDEVFGFHPRPPISSEDLSRLLRLK